MAAGQSDNRLTTYLLQHAGVKRSRPQDLQLPRKSARLEASHQDKPATVGNHNSKSGANREKHTQQHQKPVSRKRSRTWNDPASPEKPSDVFRKRQRVPVKEDTTKSALRGNLSEDDEHPIAYWVANKRWPQKYFEKGKDMENILARKRSRSARSRKNSDADSATPSSNNQSEQTNREQKSTEYKRPAYKDLLETKGIFMEKSTIGTTDASKVLCRELSTKKQTIPPSTLFDDDIFDETCKMVQDRNESKIIQDITRLIVPSAQVLAIRGGKLQKRLIESVNEGWNNSIPITKTRPQPDYAVGFRRLAFTEDQLNRMHPVVGDFNDQSYFMATWYMYFPFLTCEVKCGAAALDVADRQNAHSAAIAVRAVVELFRAVKREKELHREILAFSISHDHRSVRIYGYYAEIEESGTKYFRHPIRTFDFTELDGKEKWTAYKIHEECVRQMGAKAF